MIAPPIKRDLVVPQGVTYPVRLRYKDSNDTVIDLTGATIEAQLRKSYDQASPDLTCTPYLDGSHYFGFTLAPADTSALEATSYFYDIVITESDGDTTRALEGTISITPEVSK